jgi:hypothetical protein
MALVNGGGFNESVRESASAGPVFSQVPGPDHHIAMSTKNPISRIMKSNVSILK